MESAEEIGKRMLTQALQIAKTAVILDTENQIEPALQAYGNACDLLSVMLQDKTRFDRPKLQQIYDTYADRVLLLEGFLSDQNDLQQDSVIEYTRHSGTSKLIQPSFVPSSMDRTLHHDADSTKGKRIVSGASDELAQFHNAPRRPPPLESNNFTQSGHATVKRSSAGRPGVLRTTTEPVTLSVPPSPVLSSTMMQKPNSATSEASPRKSIGGHPVRAASGSYQASMRSSPTASTERPGSQGRRKVSTGSLLNKSAVSVSLQSPKSSAQSFPGSTGDWLSRPYALFLQLRQTLASSATAGKTVQLTPALFVSTDIWLQKGCKIKAEEEKIQAYEPVIKGLRALCLVEEAEPHIAMASLAQLEIALVSARASLARRLGERFEGCLGYRQQEAGKVPTRKMSSASRGFSKFLSRRTTSTASHAASGDASHDGGSSSLHAPSTELEFEGYHQTYQAALAQIFETSQVMMRLNASMDPDKWPVKEQLRFEQLMRHAADFFGNVVIKLYLNDLGSLLTYKLAQKPSFV